MDVEIVIHDHQNLPELTAQALAQMANDCIANSGQCVIALSGGKSPAAMLDALAKLPLQWPHITLLLVDERWTQEPEHQNQTMISAFLEKIPGAKPHFKPLLIETDFDANLNACNELSEAFNSVDIVVLGMGLDGHTASLFPDAPEFSSAMKSKQHYVAVTPTQAPFKRISMSFRWIKISACILLYIPGEEKLNCFNSIIESTDSTSPIKTLVTEAKTQILVYSSKG